MTLGIALLGMGRIAEIAFIPAGRGRLRFCNLRRTAPGGHQNRMAQAPGAGRGGQPRRSGTLVMASESNPGRLLAELTASAVFRGGNRLELYGDDGGHHWGRRLRLWGALEEV